MTARHRPRSRQGELFERSTRSAIAIDENHRLVQMARLKFRR